MNKLFDTIDEKQVRHTAIEFSSIKKVEGEDNLYKMTISTNQVDRYDEVVIQTGMQTDNYMLNPVVLWGHDYRIPAIGQTIKLIKQVKKTIAHFKFADTVFAQEIKSLVDGKFLRASSIGFMPLDFDQAKGTHIKYELFEWSLVNIPANPGALALMAKGIKELECKELEVYVCKQGDTGCKICSKIMSEIKRLETEAVKDDTSKAKDNTITTEEVKTETKTPWEAPNTFYDAKDIDLEFLKEFEGMEMVEEKLKGEVEVTDDEKEILDKFCEVGLSLKKKNGIIDEINQELSKAEKPLSEKINQLDDQIKQLALQKEADDKEEADIKNLIKISSKALNLVLSKKNNKNK